MLNCCAIDQGNISCMQCSINDGSFKTAARWYATDIKEQTEPALSSLP